MRAKRTVHPSTLAEAVFPPSVQDELPHVRVTEDTIIWFIPLVWFNQIHETDQMNQRDQSVSESNWILLESKWIQLRSC